MNILSWIIEFIRTSWVGKALIGLGMILLLRFNWKRKGAKAANDKMKERDSADAETIRRRMHDARTDGMRSEDERGYRD